MLRSVSVSNDKYSTLVRNNNEISAYTIKTYSDDKQQD